MTSDNAIPRQLQDDVPGAPRDVTRLYFDTGTAFGAQHATPRTDESPSAARYLDWSDAQIDQAAEVGARNGDHLTIDAIEHVCGRYVAFEQREIAGAAKRLQLELQLAAAQGVASAWQRRAEALSAELVDERSERIRIAELHADQSALIRRMIDGDPPSLGAAFDRAAKAVTGMGAAELSAVIEEQTRRHPDDRFDDSDTEVVDVEELQPTPGGAS